jgi:hypothetical protein
MVSPAAAPRQAAQQATLAALFRAVLDGDASHERVCHFKSDNPNLNALKDTYDYICH